MVFVPLFIVALAACETLGGLSTSDDTPSGKRDGGSSGSSGSSGKPSDGSTTIPDGGDEPSGCDVSQPFGVPELQTDLDGTGDAKGAVMTADGLEVFYLRKASPWELRHGRRTSRSAPWEVFTDPLNPSADSALSLTASGLKLYFWKLDSDGQAKNYVAKRATREQNFGAPSFIITPKGRPMFVAEADDGGYWAEITQADSGVINETIVRGNLTTNGFLTGAPIANLHEAGALDSKPVVNASETVIYFSSNRPGGNNDSGDIFSARRPSKTSSFGAPVREVELSSTSTDSVTWVSPDDCEVLLDRASHIYLARRPK